MFSVAILGVVLGSTPAIDVAFAARFYYPPGDKRISRFAVYVSDIRGRNRKRISPYSSEAPDVRWIDRNTISWVYESEFRYSTLTGKVKKRNIARSDDGMRVSSQKAGYFLSNGDHDGSTNRITIPGFGVIVEDRDVQGFRGPNGKVVKWTADFGSGWESRFFRSKRKDESFYAYHMCASSAGCTEDVLRVDWENSTAKTILRDVVGTTFDLETGYFVAAQGGKRTAPYGETKFVWSRELYSGNLYSNERWSIATGLVWCLSFDLRPVR